MKGPRGFYIRLVSTLFALALATAPAPALLRANPNILVINSYSPNYAWTAAGYGGIVSELDASGLTYQLYTEYLDWKRFPTREHLDSLSEVFGFKYRNLRLDLVVTMDDAALAFALEHRLDIFSNASIIFSGVFEDSARELIADRERVTGIYEKVDVRGTIRAALTSTPTLSRVYILNERTETGKALDELMKREIAEEAPDTAIYTLSDYPVNAIERIVSILPDDSIVLLGAYFADLNQHEYSVGSTVRRIAYASCVPVYTVYRHLFMDGITGGSLLDGAEMGREVAKAIVAEMRGTLDEDAPPRVFDRFSLTYDWVALKRFGIPVSALPPQAEIVNMPPSIFRQYPVLVFVSSNVLLILVVLTILLYRNNRSIRTIAYKDSLTGLVNQQHVFKYTDSMLSRTAAGLKAGLLHVDIDNFQLVNDIYGHALGDLVLKETARRLLENAGPKMRAARFGGDEFLIFIQDCTVQDIVATAREVRSKVQKPMFLSGKEILVDITIGIAVYPDHGREFRILLQNADMAMHRGKHGGKSRSEFFNFDMSRELSAQVDMEHGLREALAGGELSVVYQPQVKTGDGRLIGFEALARWNSPNRGPVPPSDFIPIAEQSNLIVEIGDYVFRKSVDFVREASSRGLDNFTISVNVSIRQFSEADFAGKLLRMVGEVDPGRIILEVTESIMVDGFSEVSSKLDALRNAGFRIALDDFGTGYSSLNYLKSLPIHIVKIDKTFVDSLLTDQRSQPLTQHVIGLCHELGYSVVAEGIETSEQRDFLLSCGCDEIQGYYFSRPLQEGEALALIGRTLDGRD